MYKHYYLIFLLIFIYYTVGENTLMKSVLCTRNDKFSFCKKNKFKRSDILNDEISENDIDSPFEEIVTRAPEVVDARLRPRVPPSPVYNIYPIFYPKGPDYCPNMMAIFRFTCQPSKPLRLDLVEFCKVCFF